VVVVVQAAAMVQDWAAQALAADMCQPNSL
jgi:hypothetical protein